MARKSYKRKLKNKEGLLMHGSRDKLDKEKEPKPRLLRKSKRSELRK